MLELLRSVPHRSGDFWWILACQCFERRSVCAGDKTSEQCGCREGTEATIGVCGCGEHICDVGRLGQSASFMGKERPSPPLPRVPSWFRPRKQNVPNLGGFADVPSHRSGGRSSFGVCWGWGPTSGHRQRAERGRKHSSASTQQGTDPSPRPCPHDPTSRSGFSR